MSLRSISTMSAAFCLLMVVAACGADDNDSTEPSMDAPDEAMAVFDIAGHSHRVPISCFVGSRQMAVSPKDSGGEGSELPDGMSSLSVSADLTEDRNQLVVMAMSDSEDPRHLYHWVVRDGDEALGEFHTLSVDREERRVRAEAVFHNIAYDSDDALFERGEEQAGVIDIRC